MRAIGRCLAISRGTAWGPTLRDGLVGHRVHAHGDGEVLQLVEEAAEVPELLERDAAQGGFHHPLHQPVDVEVIPDDTWRT